jgi:hypothetical protein
LLIVHTNFRVLPEEPLLSMTTHQDSSFLWSVSTATVRWGGVFYYAGRVITVLNSTDPSSVFAVRATDAPLVDYVVEELLVEIAGLGTSAYAKVEADVLLARNTARHAPAPLWEDCRPRPLPRRAVRRQRQALVRQQGHADARVRAAA